MNSCQLLKDKDKFNVLDETIIKNIKNLFNFSTTKQKKLYQRKVII